MGWGLKENPRGRIRDWKIVLREIEKIRKNGRPLRFATLQYGIADSTYYEWKKRLAKERR